MAANAERFTGRVAEYARYRERYDPDVILPLQREWCGLRPEWLVADVGAGTGLLAEVFLVNGNRVIAVEPNAEMRAACAHELAVQSRLEIVEGTAEATGFEAASVDMVTAGRAMHWFDADAAMREFQRVLKPAGWVTIIAFGRADDGRAENEAFEDLLRSLTPERKDTHANYGMYSRLEEFFPRGEFHHVQIGGEMRLNWEELRGMTLSLSHAPLPADPIFEDFERGLREFFETYANGGRVTMVTRYWINAGRFAVAPAS